MTRPVQLLIATLLLGATAWLVLRARDPATAASADPVWIRLAEGFQPTSFEALPDAAPISWSGGSLTIAPGQEPGEVRCRASLVGAAWREEGGGLWSAALPTPALMPPPGQPPRPARLTVDGAEVRQFRGSKLKRVLEGILVGEFTENLSSLTRGARPRFGLLDGRVYLLAEDASVRPGAAELRYVVVLGDRAGRTWRVLFEDRAAEGIPLLPGRPARVRVDIPKDGVLRFDLCAVRGPGFDAAPVELTVRLDGEPIGRVTQPASLETGPTSHALVLPRAGRTRAELTFETSGALAVTAVLHPVVGPAEIGDLGARPWPRERPDIVFVVGDTFRADNLAAWGGDPAITPHLNGLAESSRRYLAARAPATSTLPSHAAMFTGRYPPQCGVHTGLQRLPEDAATLAETLRAGGYRTVAITDAGFVSWQYGLSQGFESFEQSWTTDFDETLRATERVLAADDGRPLFLFLHSYRAHNPYRVEPETRRRLAGRFPLDGADWDALIQPVVKLMKSGVRGDPLADPDQALALFHNLYRCASADFDAGFGALVEVLEDAGLLRDAVLVFTSDHGEAFGSHGVIGHGRGVWEDEARVPLLLKAPGVRAAADERNVSLIDLPPTLALLAGLEPHPEWLGRDLVDEAPRTTPVFAFTASWLEDLVEVAAIQGDRKLILDARGGPGALRHAYSLADDPGEGGDARDQAWAEELRRALTTETAEVFVGPQSRAYPEVPTVLREQLDALGYGGGDDDEDD